MKRKLLTGLCLGAALAVAAVIPQSASAATLDINGNMVDEGVKMVKGTTMIAQDNLRDVLMLNLTMDNKKFTLTNDDKTVTIEGTVGKKTLLVNDEKLSLPVPATFKDEQLWLPLRPLMETFGQVDWDSESRRVRATFDYTRFNALPAAKPATTTIPYEIMVNSGVGALGDSDVPINVDYEGLGILTEMYEEGVLVSVNNGQGPVIKPMHDGYQLHALNAQANGYAYDSKAFCWQEVPSTAGTDKDRAYLYIQARQDGAAPICLDEFSLDVDNGTVLSDVAYRNGKVVWSSVNRKTHQFILKCYDLDTQKTQILEDVGLPQLVQGSFYDTHVTVGDDVAACMVAAPSDSMRYFGTVTRYDLGGKTDKKVIGRGYNLLMPEIYGDRLLVVAASGASNVMAQPKPLAPTDLWCYDLKSDQWCYRVPATLSGTTASDYRQGIPTYLDSNHAVLDLLDVGTPYDLMILDVAKGTFATTKNKQGNVLQYAPSDMTDAAISQDPVMIFHHFTPCRSGNLSYGRTYYEDGGVPRYMLYAVDFNW